MARERSPQLTEPRTSRIPPGERWLRLVHEAEAAEAVPRPRSEWLERGLNLGIALLGLTIAAPAMILIAIAVKISSRGPILYTQTRVGMDRRWNRRPPPDAVSRRAHDLGGRVFTIYKFRTMCVHAEHLSGAVWAAKEDPRVTRLGRFLRQYRLDELPQLFNVIKGDMNIVGPRPERPGIFANLRKNIPSYHYRQRARPGITGLAQISQHYDRDLDDVKRKLEYDLEYMRRHGFWEDLRIMFRTVPVILFKRGGW